MSQIYAEHIRIDIHQGGWVVHESVEHLKLERWQALQGLACVNSGENDLFRGLLFFCFVFFLSKKENERQDVLVTARCVKGRAFEGFKV